MKITVVGTGYVGLVTGACLSEMGNFVVCLDLDLQKVALLNAGGIPIHEPGLDDIVRRNVAAGRLKFTTNSREALEHGVVQFIAVGTPPDEDGSADLTHVLAAARDIGRYMPSAYTVVVNKSTVPVGTGDKVRQAIADELALRGATASFSVVSNPEFLKEGAAVADFMRPDRIVVGTDSEPALGVMRALYEPFLRNHDRLLSMDIRSAELTKYAANAMLATRISFMNELALLAERLDADIESVRKGIGSDPRIGFSFLYAGCGYGGSCFPKDVKALAKTAQDNNSPLTLLMAVEKVNERQKNVLADKLVARFGPDLKGKTFAVWGLAFKPNTDDMREAPSRSLIENILARGARVRAYDPVADKEARRILGERPGLEIVPNAYEAATGADAVIIVTEWREFRTPDWDQLRALMKSAVVIDGRNLFSPAVVKAQGFEYDAIGRRDTRA
ncbi:MAG: UDP-glucose/GDP-mannose dehydrogenase family protein [Rhodoferax sp.]|nr:UDP-glucose/GDP-mannose dehydrogenase family protein [Rhodoferax sp.]